MSTVRPIATVAAALAACAATASAQVDITQPNTTLAMVLGNHFNVGDKQFTLSPTAFTSPIFNPSEIFISPVINADPATGEGFRLTGAFNDPPLNGSSLFTLVYDVAVRPEFAALNRISSAATRFNGFATGAGSQSRIDANLTVESIGAGSLAIFATESSSLLQDERSLSNVLSLRMTATGTFDAAGETGTAGASFMDFSFGRAVIPSPAALTTLLAGIALTRRRR